MNNLVYEECKDWSIFPHMINSWKDFWEFVITSKFNSFEFSSTQSAQKSVRKNILNAKIVLKCYSFWGSKPVLNICSLSITTALCYVGKILESLLIWSIIETINFLFK